MGATLYYGMYPRKCTDREVLPYLSVHTPCRYDYVECEMNGKHVPESFYDACRQYAVNDEDNDCYIFEDTDRLFEFAALNCVPAQLTEFIMDEYRDETPILIIWRR